MVEQGQRLSRLVENLLDVSRLQTGHAEPHREPVELAELLEAARDSIGARGEPVRLALDADLPALSADPTQLERAFANLLENAVVHGERPAGPGPLAAGRAARWSSASSTAGPGIPEGSASGSSSRSTGRRARRRGNGSGLGLAIARGFIEANGGEIEVESLPGQGQQLRRQLRRAPGGGAGGERAPCRASSSATTSRRSCGR